MILFFLPMAPQERVTNVLPFSLPFLPICDLFPCPPDCLCLLVYFSFIPHLPYFCAFPASLPLPTPPPSPRLFFTSLYRLRTPHIPSTVPHDGGLCCSAECGCQRTKSVDLRLSRWSSLGGSETQTCGVFILSRPETSPYSPDHQIVYCSFPSEESRNAGMRLCSLVVEVFVSFFWKSSALSWHKPWTLPCPCSALAWGPGFNQLCIIGVIPCLAVYFNPSV